MTVSTPGAAGRIFISYRRDDTGWAAMELSRQLGEHFGRGRVFRDIQSIQPGDNFVEKITTALEGCVVLLALIGKEWLTITGEDGRRRLENPGDFVRLEVQEALTRGIRVIPVLIDGAQMPSIDNLPPILADLVKLQAVELVYGRFESDAGQLIRALEKSVPPQARQGMNRYDSLPPARVGDGGEGATLVTGDTIKAPTDRLPPAVRGRDDLLAELGQAVRTGSELVQVLSGNFGVGKSTVALALADKDWWSDVWWISSADKASLRAGLFSVARELQAGQPDLQAIGSGWADGPDRVWRLLEDAPEGWLLVFDNADEPQLLAAPAPPGGGQAVRLVADGTGWIRRTERGTVVVTSRDSAPAVWGRQAQVHRLGLLAEQDATEVLHDLAPAAGTRAEAQQLARRLGSLPLALQLAGAAIGSAYGPWASFADYHAALEDNALEEVLPDGYIVEAGDPRAAITSICELSLDALARHGIQQARPLLRLLSCYAAAVPIPESLLSGPATAALLADYEAGDRAIDRRERASAERALALGLGGLARVGLIDLETVPGAPGRQRWIVIHLLVAETSQLNLKASAGAGQASAIRHAAVKLLAARVSELIADHPADWKAWGMLVPHVFSLLSTSAPALDAGDLAALLTAAASAIDFLDWSGATQAGYDLGCAAVAKGTRLRPEDPALIHLRSRFACAVGALGRWDEAEGVYRQVLKDQEALGYDHPDTLATRHELARAVGEQGRWREAEAGFRAVLRARRQVLGDDHRDTLTTRHALAYAVGAQGHWDQAESEFREVFYARARLLGEKNFHTLITRNEWARALAEQSRWQDAETMYREVLLARRDVLGEESRDTLATWHALAYTIERQGRRTEAAAEYRQVLDAELRILGKDDPATVAAGQALRGL